MEKIKEEQSRGESVFLLDGFPRNLEQNKAFKEMMNAEYEVSFAHVVRNYLLK